MKKTNGITRNNSGSRKHGRRACIAILMLLALVVAQFGSSGLTASVLAADEEEAVEAEDAAEDGTLTVEIDDDAIAEAEEAEDESQVVITEAAEAAEEAEAEDAEAGPEESEEAEEEVPAQADVVTFEKTKDDVTVTVEAPEGALPEGAELTVERFAEDSDEYKEAAKAINYVEADGGMAALDISFTVDGKEVEPDEAVKVSIDVSQILPGDADASSIEVQHIEENLFGLIKNAKVVANASSETEGTIDEANATAEFMVDSFSKFTIEWGDGDSIVVHVYNMTGTGIEEVLDTEYEHDGGDILISDIVDHLHGNSDYVSSYHYEYATVIYEYDNGVGGYDETVLGSQDNSVTEVSKSGTSYTITYANGSTTTVTVTDSSLITIHMYYSLPTVTITVDDPTTEPEVTLTTTNEYFKGLEASDASTTYTWYVPDSSRGSVTGNGSSATFTWAEGLSSGDQATITVTMTNTYTDPDTGETITESASDTYTLTYGAEAVTITVNAVGGGVQANAHVALVDTDGNTVATGTTGTDGTVTLYVPAGTYTVGVTYVAVTDTEGPGTTTRYTVEGSVTVPESGGASTTVTLATEASSDNINGSTGVNYSAWDGTTPYYYEHVDVKVAVADSGEGGETFSDLDSVYIFDKYGNLIYRSDDLIANEGTTDYNCKFDLNGTEDVHSIVVSSTDTIVITYEVTDNETEETKTYTATLRGDATYADDEYYGIDSVNAYKLYNAFYGTSLESNADLAAIWNDTNANYNENGLPLTGLYYIQVADILCDTSQSSQAGLDFVIDVSTIATLITGIDLDLEKEYEDVPANLTADDLGTFSFDIIELSNTYVQTTDTTWYTTDGQVVSYSTASTTEWTLSDGTWSSPIVLADDAETDFTYESETGTNFYYYIIRETTEGANPTVQYYGLMVIVNFNAEENQSTIWVQAYELTKVDDEGLYGTYEFDSDVSIWIDPDTETGSYPLTFVNTYDVTGFYLTKTDGTDQLEGATFNLTAQGDSDPLTFVYDETSNTYTLSSDDGASADITVGSAYIYGIASGTYVLTETAAPTGYDSITDSITVVVDDEGNVTVSGSTHASVSDDDPTTVIVVNDLTTTDIEGEKTWEDSDNNYNTRPSSITIHLLADGTEVDSTTVTSSDNWTWSFTDLPVYNSDGSTIEYTITEDTVPGYTTEVSGYNVTNTMETVDVEGSKTWSKDDGYADSYRPTSITIHLFADGTEVDSATVTSSDNWAWSFTDLPKYQSDGTTEIEYTITEDAVPGYTSEVSGYDVTNTLVTTEVSGEKTWVDEDNANDTRPDSITIYLYADGVQTGDTAVVTSSDNWAWEFTDLPKYQSDGTTVIVYTIMEGETEEGHLGEYIPSYSEDGLSVTNAIPEVSKYVSDPEYDESVEEELDEDEADNNDTLEYEIKAEHIGSANELVFHDFLDNHLDIETLEIESVMLYKDADDSGTEITDYEYTTDTCGGEDCGLDGCSFEISIPDTDVAGLGSDAYIVIIFDITLKEDVDQFDDEYVAETDNWANISFFSYYATPVEVETYSYGFDLYKYDGDTDDPLEGVEFVMSNSNGEYAQFEVTDETYLLDGWTDSKDNATTIVTGSDGQAIVEGLHDGTFNIEETKALDGYQKIKGNITVTITVDEDEPTNPTITATGATYEDGEVKIENTPGEDLITIVGSKTWDDADDADGIRPDSITINLLDDPDGDPVATQTVTADDNWAWSFTDLPEYDSDGNEINYILTEAEIDGYTYSVDGYDVTNTHEYETRDISGSKTWEDDDDKADARPASITVNLYQDGDLYDSLTVTEDDDWAWSWSDLPKNKDGEAIAYTITEDEVDDYTVTYYSGSFDITNTFEGEEEEGSPKEGGDIPKTGDNNNLLIWALVMLLACLSVGEVYLVKRRRK